MRLLYVTSRYPWPARRGDQLRAAQVARLLSGRVELTLLVPEPPPAAQPPPALSDLSIETYRLATGPGRGFALVGSLLSGAPIQNGLFASSDLDLRLRELAPRFDLTVLQLVRLERYAAALGGRPFVADLIDSLSLNLEGRARFDHPLLRPLWRLEAKRLARAEVRMLAAARVGLVVCRRDADALVARGAPRRPEVLPLAIDTAPRTEPIERAERVCLTGNLGYFVNADAARWWGHEVWPRLHATRPNLRWLIAGARPSKAVRALARLPGVELHDSPPDLRRLVAASRVALAPMRCGSGQPLKILEAWAEGVPVVATSWAAAGTTGEPGRDLLVASGAGEWVEAVVALLDRTDVSSAIAEAARRCLERDYRAEPIAAAWLGVLGKA